MSRSSTVLDKAVVTRAPPELNIVAAMDHPGLFGQWFSGPSWDNWRAVLKAAYALPMRDDEGAFFKSVAGDRDPPTKRVRELWVVGGRRSGKDSIASLILGYSAGLFDGQNKLRHGERATSACVACSREQSQIILNYTRSYFQNIPPFKSLVQRETANGFQLKNGVDVVVNTNSFRSARGIALLTGILDECAFYMDEHSARPDVATYRALVPATATLLDHGAMIVGISTPHKQSGLLWDKYKAHFGKDGDVLVIQAASTVLNPTLPKSIIEQAMEDDPIAAAAELNAEWRSDIAGYVSMEVLEACTDGRIVVREPMAGVVYFAFVDSSSGSGRDSFCCGIAHVEGDRVVLDVAHEIRPPFNPSGAIKEICDLLKSYRIHKVYGDKYAAGFVTELFGKNGLRYEHSEFDRSEIYLECLPLLTSGRARLLDLKRLVSQFGSLERRTMSTGRDIVDHPKGDRHHDDLANAVAGALALAGARKQTLVITKEHVAMVAARGPYRGSAMSSLESRMGERAYALLRSGRRF
jgi:hypothetical protein